jgi:hypothetical protein
VNVLGQICNCLVASLSVSCGKIVQCLVAK